MFYIKNYLKLTKMDIKKSQKSLDQFSNFQKDQSLEIKNMI